MKDIILIAAGMVLTSTWTGALLVVEETSLASSLSQGLPEVYCSIQPVTTTA